MADDAPEVARIHLAARRTAMPWLREVHSDEETYAWAATILPAENEIWVAEADGRVVAFAAIAPGWLNHLYVDPEWRGRGIGRRLLDLAKERNPEEVLLWTFARNARARRFYENGGFVVIEETDGAGNEEREPDVRYRWRPEASASQ
jgi:GNAT superfamily N-acetyltransferase